ALSDERAFEVIRHQDGWAGLRFIVMLERRRTSAQGTQTETAYFISSLPADAQLILQAVRAHWSIENTFHWTLDIAFREDDARLRSGDSPENFATLRISLNLLKQHPAKLSVKRKPFKAAWAIRTVSSGISGTVRGRMGIIRALLVQSFNFVAILRPFSPQSIWPEFASGIASGNFANDIWGTRVQ